MSGVRFPLDSETREYYESLGLSQIKAAAAYERGAEGCGTTIAVIDTGVYVRDADGNVRLHRELQDKVGPQENTHSFHQTNSQEFPLSLPEVARRGASHGTWVSTIAAGKRDGQGTHGVAPGAFVLSRAIPLGTSDGVYNPVDVSVLESSAPYFAGIFSEVLSAGADVINASFGFEGLSHTYNSNQIREAMRPLSNVLAQFNRAAADRTVIVFAAGNANGDPQAGSGDPVDAISPEILSGLPLHIPELRGHMLAVAAVGTNGAIAHYSNRCGVARKFLSGCPGHVRPGGYSGHGKVCAADSRS